MRPVRAIGRRALRPKGGRICGVFHAGGRWLEFHYADDRAGHRSEPASDRDPRQRPHRSGRIDHLRTQAHPFGRCPAACGNSAMAVRRTDPRHVHTAVRECRPAGPHGGRGDPRRAGVLPRERRSVRQSLGRPGELPLARWGNPGGVPRRLGQLPGRAFTRLRPAPAGTGGSGRVDAVLRKRGVPGVGWPPAARGPGLDHTDLRTLPTGRDFRT